PALLVLPVGTELADDQAVAVAVDDGVVEPQHLAEILVLDGVPDGAAHERVGVAGAELVEGGGADERQGDPAAGEAPDEAPALARLLDLSRLEALAERERLLVARI